jgi:hypothetical protein
MYFLFNFFFFGGTGVLIPDLKLARQEFCHRSHTLVALLPPGLEIGSHYVAQAGLNL